MFSKDSDLNLSFYSILYLQRKHEVQFSHHALHAGFLQKCGVTKTINGTHNFLSLLQIVLSADQTNIKNN